MILKRLLYLFLALPPFRMHGTETGPVLLDRRRVFILPTAQGVIFALVLLLMMIGSINYNLNLGYILVFLLGSMALVSILHTFRNLAQLSVSAGSAEPVFAGQDAHFHLSLANPGSLARHAVALRTERFTPVHFDIPAATLAHPIFSVATTRRGILKPGPFVLFTEFPLGLFHAWCKLQLHMSCLVYPRPDPEGTPLPGTAGGKPGELSQGTGSDDFAGLRPYQPGDSPRHIAWKSAARGEALLTKQFSGQAPSELWLEWDSLPGLDDEARLSRLCRWVLDAAAADLNYGLRLPGNTLSPDTGAQHRERCLEALARYGLSEG